jgi:Cof subfamily protein (haloacid dehalogenase superfamily)
MKYKMLVLDLDDTLLTDDHQISERNIAALMEAQEMGVKVVLASGRPTPAMQQYAAVLQMDKYSTFMISYNGAVITDLSTQTTIFEQSLSVSDIAQLYDFSIEQQVAIITYIDGSIIANTYSDYVEVEKQITGMPLRIASDFMSEVVAPTIKCILLDDPIQLKTVEARLKALMPAKNICTSKPFFLEVTASGIDKASSISHLASRLGIHQSEIIAVGNAHNDLSMVQYAGLGVWVANVSPELRHLADLVVSSNQENGVAEVVEQYILPRI